WWPLPWLCSDICFLLYATIENPEVTTRSSTCGAGAGAVSEVKPPVLCSAKNFQRSERPHGIPQSGAQSPEDFPHHFGHHDVRGSHWHRGITAHHSRCPGRWH